MEKQINQKLEQHQVQFKADIKEWLSAHNASVIDNKDKTTLLTGEFLQFIYDYNNMQINENDLKKRKRIKNVVPQFELCIAKRANGEQCTRRKKAMEEGDKGDKGEEGEGASDASKKAATHFCGTHIKGIPHGVVSSDIEIPKPNTKVEVWVKDIKGINYYIDSNHNVYKPEDILTNKINPAIIAKWTKLSEDVYSIPQFGI
jgi:hypothetical protein